MLFLIFILPQIIQNLSIAKEYRSYDGSSNNKKHPDWGKASTPFARHFPPSPITTSPNPIALSQLAKRTNSASQDKTILNAGLGQFIAHDLGFMTPKTEASMRLGNQIVPFKRATSVFMNNADQQINDVSHWLDGSVIYGTVDRHSIIAEKPFLVETRFGLKRAFKDQSILGDKQKTLSTGDVRGNDNPLLMQFQILFVKEHNRWVEKLSHLDLDDQTLFEEARRRVIAVLQHITFDEYLPLLLGESLPGYKGYDESVFPNVENFFSAVAMRHAHSNVIDIFQLIDESGKSQGDFSVKNNSFQSSYLWEKTNSKTLFISMSFMKEKQTNIQYDDVLRQIKTRSATIDMFAIDVQRARDSRTSNYLQGKKLKIARQFFLGETKNPKINDILNHCANKEDILRAYDFKIERIDSLIGVLCESPVKSRFIGPTVAEALKQTFLRLREGDRFWYENDLDEDEIKEIKSLTLADIIRMNFNIKDMRNNVLQI